MAKGIRDTLHQLIYEAETPAGRLFDICLMVFISLSVLSAVLESITSIAAIYGPALRAAEWFFTILFTIEYVLRVICIKRPKSYVLSFYGLIDLVAILPTYLSLYLTGAQSLTVVRAVRLLRIFRVLKLMRFLGEASVLWQGLRASLPKIIVFLGSVVSAALVMGTVMYLVEGPENGFTSIPKGIYWAIVTLTTVGFGDITPQTWLGQLLAAFLMIAGYGVIAVPAGIVSVQIAEASKSSVHTHGGTRCCPSCSSEDLGLDSKFCRFCGESLQSDEK